MVHIIASSVCPTISGTPLPWLTLIYLQNYVTLAQDPRTSTQRMSLQSTTTVLRSLYTDYPTYNPYTNNAVDMCCRLLYANREMIGL